MQTKDLYTSVGNCVYGPDGMVAEFGFGLRDDSKLAGDFVEAMNQKAVVDLSENNDK